MRQLFLHKKREKSILNKHHWVFSGAVKTCDSENGSIVSIHQSSGELLGYGFYDAKSQIACRVFDWSNSEIEFDIAYWKQKLSNAFQLRNALLDQSQTNCVRLLHAEGDFFPGLIIDQYNEVLVLQPKILAIEKLLPTLKTALSELGYQHIYVKPKSNSSFLEHLTQDSGWLLGKTNELVQVKENGLKFNINVETGQKTGFFIDQRNNRQDVRNRAADKTVLNAFSYTGGFSLYALAGGAKQVDSVDISSKAIDMANELIALNNLSEKHNGIVADCFDFLNEMPADHYNLIVLDPPAFAKNRRALKNASQGYKQINLKALRKIKKGGLLYTFSCSQAISKDLFQKIVFGAAVDAKREVRIIARLDQPEDHPVNIYHPETEYLKGLLLYVS